MWIPDEMTLLNRLMKIIMLLAMLTPPVLLCFATLIFLIKPCFPASFGYLVLHPCVDTNASWSIFPDLILRNVLLYFMIRMGLHVSLPLTLECGAYSSLHCWCLINYNYLFWEKISTGRLNIFGAVKMYKEIQLLLANYNLIHGSLLSVVATIYIGSNLIVCTYGLVALYSEMSLPEYFFFVISDYNCFLVILFCDGEFKSAVNSVSTSILGKLMANTELMRKPIMRRYLRSWPRAKITLGGTNFYDKETALNLVQFCITQVVNLLLL